MGHITTNDLACVDDSVAGLGSNLHNFLADMNGIIFHVVSELADRFSLG